MSRELPGGDEHQLAHTLQSPRSRQATYSARECVCIDTSGCAWRPRSCGALRADGPVAESRAFGRAGDDADMQGHVIPLVKR